VALELFILAHGGRDWRELLELLRQARIGLHVAVILRLAHFALQLGVFFTYLPQLFKHPVYPFAFSRPIILSHGAGNVKRPRAFRAQNEHTVDPYQARPPRPPKREKRPVRWTGRSSLAPAAGC